MNRNSKLRIRDDFDRTMSQNSQNEEDNDNNDKDKNNSPDLAMHLKKTLKNVYSSPLARIFKSTQGTKIKKGVTNLNDSTELDRTTDRIK